MPTPISSIVPSIVPTGITLSNNNLTFVNTTASDKVLFTYPLLRFGKWYWEVTNGATYSVNTVRMVGIANMANNVATFLGSTNNTLGYNGAGTVTYNNATVTTIQTYAANSIISIALDLDNNMIWFRTDAGLWNNSGTANPETNVGGITVALSTGGLYVRPAVGCSTVNNGATINFGDTAFTQVQPAGFNSVNNWTYAPEFANRNASIYRDETGSTNYPTARTATQVTAKSTFPASQEQFLYGAFYGDRRPFSPAATDLFVAGRTFVTGTIAPDCKILVLDNNSGELINSTKTNALGEYKLSAIGRPKVTVVGSFTSDNYNSMVFTDVVPVNLGPVRGQMSRSIPITSSIRANVIHPTLPISALTYTGTTQRYMIPNDNSISTLSVSMWGGGGAGGQYSGGSNGGAGGFTTVTIPVQPFDIIDIQVGQGGQKTAGGLGGVGGWPDGGGGGRGDTLCGGGGGSSRIWKNDQLIAVAGAGGGGSGYSPGGEAGAGGGSSGQSSSSGGGGTGGSQTAGGFDPSDGNAVKTGLQIVSLTNRTGGWGAATGDISTSTGDDGGGGGGGYWGGGGGGGDGSSGGGGSGYLAGSVTGFTSTGNYTSVAEATNRAYPGGTVAQGGVSSPVTSGGDGYILLSNTAKLTVTEQPDALDFVGDLLSIPQAWRFISGDGLTASNSNTRLTLTSFFQAWFKANSGTTRRSGDGTGSWYYEVSVTDNNPQGTLAIGIAPAGVGTTTSGNAGSSGRIQYFNTGQTRINGGYSNYGPTFTAGDKIGCSIENSAGNTLLRFYKNGTDLGVAYNLGATTTTFYEPHFCLYANQGDSTCILDIQDVTNLPAGFTIWA